MTHTLVMGLGNPLVGDDGVGVLVARLLAADPRLPPDVTVLDGGTDVLRWVDHLADAERILIVDAVLSDAPPGSLEVQRDVGDLEDGGCHAHGFSPTQALALLRLVAPEGKWTALTVVGICVEDVRVHAGLSPRLAERLSGVVQEVLQELGTLSCAVEPVATSVA